MNSGECRFRFEYGEWNDVAELIIDTAWASDGTPRLRMVAHAGAWQEVAEKPPTLIGKQMLRAGESASRLRLAFRAESWRIDGARAVRELVLVGDNGPRLAEILRELPANA